MFCHRFLPFGDPWEILSCSELYNIGYKLKQMKMAMQRKVCDTDLVETIFILRHPSSTVH